MSGSQEPQDPQAPQAPQDPKGIEETPRPARTSAPSVSIAVLALRFFAAIGLGASFLLLIDYTRPEQLFCAPGQGCDVVRLSRWASWFGIPTPVFGVIAFAAALGLSFAWNPWTRLFLGLAGVGAGLFGLGFIGLQAFSVKAWCVYCVITDISAVIFAALALVVARRPELLARRAWGASALVIAAALAVPFGVGMAQRPQPKLRAHEPIVSAELPAPIAAEQRQGQVTIVEFLDFECPFCRKQHVVLTPLLEEYGSKARVVRRHMPLSMHSKALPAARAAICAEEAGYGEQMADLLMTTEDLSPAGLEAAALRLGMDRDDYQACLASQRVGDRLVADGKAAAETGVEGLPTFYVGGERFEGLTSTETIRASIRRELDRQAGSGAGKP